MLLHTEAFTHPSFDAQMLLHTEAFTHRSFDAQMLLHTEAFTHRSLYTQTLLHTEAFTHRSFDAQMLLHAEAFTHRGFDAQMLLHTHTLALFLSRPRSATTPKAHIKCLYAPNGYGRRACRRQLKIHLQVLTAWNCAPKYLSVGNTPTKGIISHLLWQVPIFVKIRSNCGSQGLEMFQYSSLMVELLFLQELKHFFC